MPSFNKLLVANRGEIASRVMRSAQDKGYRTVAVFSDPDEGASHVTLADEAVRIGEGPVGSSYLDIDAIIGAAKASGADAIHPGYGFLSERASFAEACEAAGIVFVGPSADAIRLMGDKAASKRRMIEAGVPCVPGYEGDDQSDDRFVAESKNIGFPLMVKAAAGGGGRGMRLVNDPADLVAALRSARSEAKNAFGDDRLLLERAVSEPRHVEIQIFGDTQGNVVHLNERDCSVQRRHQKVLEEAPSPALDAKLRAEMGAAAVLAASAISYVGAGTVEFLLGQDGEFYFLEMNTRLQVEHPVTELTTGLDLVALQLDVAAGKSLPFSQADVGLKGHAIEARLYAEDPRGDFLPQTGSVLLWEPAAGTGVRTDHGLATGTEVSPFYDPMLAKIIAHGADREEARRRLVRAIQDTVILGVTTNKEFLVEALETGEFAEGEATTGFVGRHFPEGLAVREPTFEAVAVAASILCGEDGHGWRSNSWTAHPIMIGHGDTVLSILVEPSGDSLHLSALGETGQLHILSRTPDKLRYRMGNHIKVARYVIGERQLYLDLGGALFRFEDTTYAPAASGEGKGGGILRAPMSGSIIGVDVEVGDRVSRGQALAVLEAMKMEHRITSLVDGVIETVGIKKGMQVSARDVLITIRADEA